MGYHTFYSLNVRGIRNKEEFDALKRAMSGHDEEVGQVIGYALDEGFYDGNGCACFDGADFVKWYDYDDDMLALSNRFKDMTFQLHGEGEDRCDVWEAYYKNGASEHCGAELHIPRPTTIPWEEDV